jgi:hypothetical protein
MFMKSELDRSLADTTAKMNDVLAIVQGCSDYERSLRTLGPLFYNNDPNFREIMIKLKVRAYEASKPWWAR